MPGVGPPTHVIMKHRVDGQPIAKCEMHEKAEKRFFVHLWRHDRVEEEEHVEGKRPDQNNK